MMMYFPYSLSILPVNEPVAAMQQEQPATATELATGTATTLKSSYMSCKDS